MLNFEEALGIVIERASFLGRIPVALEDSAGRILAETITADLDLPPFDTTAMDGWALRAAEVQKLPASLAIAGSLFAGSMPKSPLAEGTALKVMTGAPMPAGSDAVVPVESARVLEGGRVEILEAPKQGAHIRRQGEVFSTGRPLLGPGRRLTPADLVLCAAAGRESLSVCRRARAGVLVTGDEIAFPGHPPGPGQIRNTNGPLLLGTFRRLGAETLDLGGVKDGRTAMTSRLESALALNLDFLVTTGGVSAGDSDLVAEILSKLSAEIVFHKVAIRPAKPLLFAVLGKTLLFGLPGNPVSAAVAFDLFVRAAWRRASGITPAFPQAVEAALTASAQNRGGRLAFLPGHLQSRKGRLEATPIASKGSHDIAAHAAANAYIVLEPEASLSPGDRVDAYPGTEETTLG